MTDTLRQFYFGQPGTSNGTLYTAPAATTSYAVTFTDAGDTVTLNSHGLPAGTRVYFSSITSTTGISVNTAYYVVSPTTNTFQVASSLGGSALALTTNGSGTMLYGATSVVRNIHIANTTATAATISLSVNGSGATAANNIYRTFSIPANGVHIANVNLVLHSIDTIQGLQGTSAALTVVISGVEL